MNSTTSSLVCEPPVTVMSSASPSCARVRRSACCRTAPPARVARYDAQSWGHATDARIASTEGRDAAVRNVLSAAATCPRSASAPPSAAAAPPQMSAATARSRRRLCAAYSVVQKSERPRKKVGRSVRIASSRSSCSGSSASSSAPGPRLEALALSAPLADPVGAAKPTSPPAKVENHTTPRSLPWANDM